MIKNDVTFVIISDGIKEPKRIRLSKRFMNIVLYSALFLVAAGLVRLGFYANELLDLRRVAGPILDENKELHQRTGELIAQRDSILVVKDSIVDEIETERIAHARRLAEVTDELERLENFVTDLKILAGYKLTKTDAQKLPDIDTDNNEEEGQGGPLLDPDTYLERLLDTDQDDLKGVIDGDAMVLAAELRDKRNDLKDLRNFLEKKATLLEGRPLGRPAEGTVSSEFGPRKGGFHAGIDVANRIGTPIFATGDGVVTFKGYVGAYGKMVVIDHGGEFSTAYAHMSRYAVSTGDRVERGDVIGYIGNTGRTTGPHVHYEVRVNGVPVNPRPYFDPPEDKVD